MRSAISQDLVELVADEDDAVAFVGEATQDREDLLGLLRRQHGGRLVQDEDPRLAVERLEDLDALLPADRERAHLGVRVDVEAEALAQLARCAGAPRAGRGRGGCAIVSSPSRMLSATLRTGTSMKCWWTMLMPRAMASVGPGDAHLVAVQQDLALVRACEPVEDVHERGLAGPVLAEQGVDLARAHVQVDVVVGDHTRVALGDAPHLQRRREDRSFRRVISGSPRAWVKITSGPASIGTARSGYGVSEPAVRWALTALLQEAAVDRVPRPCSGRSRACRLPSGEWRRRSSPACRRDRVRGVGNGETPTPSLAASQMVVAALDRAADDGLDVLLGRIGELLLRARDDAARSVRVGLVLVDVDADAVEAGVAGGVEDAVARSARRPGR